MRRIIGGDDALLRHEHFDVICGTNSGGIIAAALLGIERFSAADAELVYDSLLDKVFHQKSRYNLITKQARYDESRFESMLTSIYGNRRMIETNREDVPRVFLVSSRVNHGADRPVLWRNYNCPRDKIACEGSCLIPVATAIRATTAAPTFFKPVEWNGHYYCDGAFVANNPTAIAIQEAKVRCPAARCLMR